MAMIQVESGTARATSSAPLADHDAIREGRARVRRIRRVLNRIEWPLATLALLVVPVLILEDRTTDPTLRWLCNVVNWFVWLSVE